MDELDAERAFNLIDSIFVEDLLRDAELQGALVLTRAKLDKIYNRKTHNRSDEDDSEYTSGNGPIRYTEQTENGFVGLEAPLG